MDPGLPERFRQIREEQALHEGESRIYVQLVSLCYGAKLAISKNLVREKIDLAYVRYAITIDQWGRLYNILTGEDPEKPASVPPPQRNLTAQ